MVDRLALVASLPWQVGVAVAFAFFIGPYRNAAALRIKPEALSAFDRTNCGIMSIDVEALEYSFPTTLTVTLHSDWTHQVSDRHSRSFFCL
jgi:hypothetical protein